MGVFDCFQSVSKMTPTESREVFAINLSSQTLDVQRQVVSALVLTMVYNFVRSSVEGIKRISSIRVSEPLMIEKDEESQKSMCRRNVWWHLGLDIPLLVAVLAVIGLFELGIIPTHVSGFFCNDPALSFPFRGDTVSMGLLMATVLLVPSIVVLTTEMLLITEALDARSKFRRSCTITALVTRDYFYGLTFNFVVIELLKALTGKPRPTFFDLCQPDTGKTCVGSEFVSSFTCTSSEHSEWFQLDSYHSFPSGHTSLSVYTGLFVVWYLQQRAFKWSNRSVFIVPFIQLLSISYAIICSVTRVTDHRHHWWDVAVGALIGLATLYFAVVVISKNFSQISNKAATENNISEVTPLTANRPSTESLLNNHSITIS